MSEGRNEWIRDNKGKFMRDNKINKLSDQIRQAKKLMKELKVEESIKHSYLRYYYERKLLLKGFTAYYEWGVKRRENMGWEGWIKDLWTTEIWEQATDLQFEYYYKISRHNIFQCAKCGKQCSRTDVLIHHPYGYTNCFKEIFSLEHTELICKDHEHPPEKLVISVGNIKLNEEES